MGPSLLVRPVLAPAVTHVDTLLPRGTRWYNALTGDEVPALPTGTRTKLKVGLRG